MISHTHRCIFVHIPKTGGTSVEDVIWPNERTEADLWMGLVRPGYNRHQTGGLQHLLARQIRSDVGPAVFDAYFRFTIVRNPWDKIISQYAYMRERPDLRRFIGLAEDATLDEYLRRIQTAEHVQWLPQIAFIQDAGGHDIVDFIGRFERLEEGMRFVFNQIGVSCQRLPHRLASRRTRDYRDYFDARTRAEVARLYAADIDHFHYAF